VNGFLAYAYALSRGVFVGSLFLVTFAGLFMAEEFELGTAKIVFSKPLRRSEVVAAKALVLVVLAAGLVLVCALGALGVGAAFGYGDIRDAQFPDFVFQAKAAMVVHAARATVLMIPPLAGVLLVAFAVSALAEQSGVAVGLSFAALIGSLAAGWLSSAAEPFVLTSYLRFPTDTLRELALGNATRAWAERWRGNGPPVVGLGLLVSAGYALFAFLLSTGVIARREILSFLAAGGAALALLLAGGEARAAGHKLAFRVDEVAVQGQVQDVDVQDMDGDGLDDLVVFHTTGAKGPDPRRYLSIFYQRAAQRDFAARPDQTIEVPPQAAARILADLDPRAKGRELGFAGPSGVYCMVAKDRRFSTALVPLIREDGFFDIASGWQLPSWDSLAVDVNGDGLTDLFYLEKGGAVLFLGKKDGTYARAAEVPLEYRQSFGPRIEALLLDRFLSFRATLAKPALGDVDGDHLPDLVTMRDRSIDTFLQRAAEKRFADRPDRSMALRVVSGDASTSDDEFNQVRTAVHDVDGDGLADLLVYRNLGKVSLFESMRTQILFYRGTKTGWDEARPAQIINLKGVSIDPVVIDIDGDGAGDLVVSSLRTDLITNALRALFNSVTVTYFVFRYDKSEKKFHDTPDFSRDINIEVARLEGSGSIPLAYFWGDYDGDKVQDLLTLEDENALTIIPGEATSSFWSGDKLDFPESGRTRVAVETSNSLAIRDLNRDGKADVILWYYPRKTEDGDRGTIKLVLSK
jgi:ABC-type transport system involved in multi-copper enzyme maturation permease subunit